MGRTAISSRSRLATLLAAGAAIALGLAVGGALLGQRGDGESPLVAASPTPSPATASPAGSPGATPTTRPEGDDRIWAFFSRDQLPPVGAYVRGTFDDSSAEKRISSRVMALYRSAAGEAPAGAGSAVKSLGRNGVLEMTVRVEGDLATLEFGPGQFDEIHGSAFIGAVLEELVYTASEEPGIRRVLLAERGKSEFEIDNMALIRDPMTREDRLIYTHLRVKTEEKVALEDDPRPATLTTKLSEEVAPGLTRLEILMTANAPVAEGFWSPRMSAELRANSDERAFPGKWVLEIALPGGSDPNGASTQSLDGSPVRAIRTTTDASGTTYLLGLDDARPWRVSLEPGASGTMRLNVDLGGQAVSDSVAVYEPRPVTDISGRTFILRGAARAFEAHVAWRLVDSNRRELATGFATASIGASPVWGTFETEIQVPAEARGSRFVSLEVFWPSPRDGADVGTVSLSLRFP